MVMALGAKRIAGLRVKTCEDFGKPREQHAFIDFWRASVGKEIQNMQRRQSHGSSCEELLLIRTTVEAE